MRGNHVWLDEIEGMVSSLSCSAGELHSRRDDPESKLVRALRVAVNDLVVGVARARNAGYSAEGRVALHRSHSMLQHVARIVDRMGRLPNEYAKTLAAVRQQVIQLLIDFKLALQSGLRKNKFLPYSSVKTMPNDRTLLRPWTSPRTKSRRTAPLDHTARIRRYIRPLAG